MTTYLPSHIGICVSDLDRSLRFYCDGLGFEVAERYELDSEHLPGLDRSLEVRGRRRPHVADVQRGDLRIELLAFDEPGVVGAPSQRRNQLGLTHLCFYVDDVDAAAERMLERGALVLEGRAPTSAPTSVFLMDPDGVRIELMRVLHPLHRLSPTPDS